MFYTPIATFCRVFKIFLCVSLSATPSPKKPANIYSAGKVAGSSPAGENTGAWVRTGTGVVAGGAGIGNPDPGGVGGIGGGGGGGGGPGRTWKTFGNTFMFRSLNHNSGVSPCWLRYFARE